jgi:two-component system, LytTR family, sensor kinase
MKKSVKLLVHISFWVVIYLTIRLIYKTLLGDDPWPPMGYHPLWNFEALTICTLVGIAIPFYISYLLFPKFNNGNSKFIWIGLILVFLFVYPAMTTFYLHDVDVIGYSNYSNSFVTYFFFALIGGLFRVFIDWIEQSKLKDNIEKQSLKSELTLLKYQINPHFLFNTLNNIDSLIQEDSQNASLALNKLSELMRYMIHDSEHDKVPLSKEIEYIRNYISLQKLRIKNEQNIEFEVSGEINNMSIAPMIFISFVENSFKHSSLKSKKNKISIKILISNNLVDFYCSNTLAERTIEKDEASGIGLDLIKKRLELIYPNEYQLDIDKSDNNFSVSLKIKLSAN